MCPDCYDYTAHVAWQWHAPELWRRFTIALSRELAARLDVPRSRLRDHARLSFAKVAEFQRRGVVRTEELRALRWDEVHLDGVSGLPSHVAVWRSVRKGGDTKTRKSRQTLALPQRCIEALHAQRAMQERDRQLAGDRWHESGLVFASKVGTPLDPAHVRREFRRAIRSPPGIDPAEWTPRELRHSFVSLLSDHGLPLEEISRLVGHSSTAVTELVYRKQIRPVVQSRDRDGRDLRTIVKQIDKRSDPAGSRRPWRAQKHWSG